MIYDKKYAQVVGSNRAHLFDQKIEIQHTCKEDIDQKKTAAAI